MSPGVEISSLISNIVIGISTAAIAIVGFFGLRAWRKELTGKAKFDIARDMMATGFKLRADFQSARNPNVLFQDIPQRQHQEDESSGESTILDEWQARSHQLKTIVEDLTKLEEIGWQAKVILPDNINERVSEKIESLRHLYVELLSAIDLFFGTRRQEVIGKSVNTDQNWLNGLKTIIYSTPEDDFSKRIERVNNELASTLKEYMK